MTIVTGALILTGCGQLQTATTGSTTAAAAVTDTPAVTGTNTPVAAGTGTPVVTATATPGATTSPIAKQTLTDTGYTAPDGSPLYAECVEAGYSLPPKYPVPAGTVPVPPPYVADGTPMPTPRPGYAPDFDPLAVAPADSSSWHAEQSDCVGVTFRRPAEYDVIEPLRIAGYQQEAVAYGTADRREIYELHIFYTKADMLGLVRANGPAPGEYTFVDNAPAEVGGASGYVTYATEPDGAFPEEVAIGYTVMIRPNWYAQVIGFFAPPYDKTSFALFNAFVKSFAFHR